MKNIKLIVAYDGTNYHGFQEQKGTGLDTIQEVLEKALPKLTKREIKIIGAGRTDAGVHARGQVVNFKCDDWPIPLTKTALAVNALLPNDIAVLKAELVPLDFHARFSAISKTYCYRVYNERILDPFVARYALHEPRRLDVQAINEACQYLIGEHDFKSFQSKGTPVKTTIRKLTQARADKEGKLVKFIFSANGFLYNMVRIMVGTLIQVGLLKIKPEALRDILEAKDRTKAGPTAPPQGLFLERVEY
ncbi:tRNA pseudouridine(38-40) synthase TruA [Peptococcaceae bacterium]|nr:tRNA pseudouridine(38-40) synthase TruA [Peptococcaceae bacterium]